MTHIDVTDPAQRRAVLAKLNALHESHYEYRYVPAQFFPGTNERDNANAVIAYKLRWLWDAFEFENSVTTVASLFNLLCDAERSMGAAVEIRKATMGTITDDESFLASALAHGRALLFDMANCHRKAHKKAKKSA